MVLTFKRILVPFLRIHVSFFQKYVRGSVFKEYKISCSFTPNCPAGILYQSRMGNQNSGCKQPGFWPSISKWVTPSQHQPSSFPHAITCPTLRLILRLAKANATMCPVGDSVDFQFYDALRLNLKQQNHLQTDIKLDIGDNSGMPVNYTNETGSPPYMMWMTMDHIEETTVSLTLDSEDTPTYTTIILYFKMYGWSPWDVPFMDDCNMVVYNLGLHYNARSEGMNGIHWYGPKYIDDFRAAITYLVDFVSSRKGVAVWRLVLFFFVCSSCTLHASRSAD